MIATLVAAQMPMQVKVSTTSFSTFSSRLLVFCGICYLKR